MNMLITLFPTNIIEYYKLNENVLNGYVYMEICKGMYGLPQAGVLANKLLKGRLAQNGYFEFNPTHQHYGNMLKFYYQSGLTNLGDYPSKHHTADMKQHVRPYYVHMENSPTLLPRAMKPITCRGCAKILWDPYSKKSPLPSIGHLAVSSTLTSHRVLGQPKLQQRHITCSNHPRIHAQ